MSASLYQLRRILQTPHAIHQQFYTAIDMGKEIVVPFLRLNLLLMTLLMLLCKCEYMKGGNPAIHIALLKNIETTII